MPWDNTRAREHVARVETLLTALDALPDEAARTWAAETAEALVDLYGECLARIMDRLAAAGQDTAVAAVAADELVGRLLLVHDLHPLPTEQRIRDALARTGVHAELLAVEDGAARIRVQADGAGCRSSAAGVAAAVREAVALAAPEIQWVETVAEAPPQQAFIPAEDLLAGMRAAAGRTP
jgi:Fe-S cluster biogenesis protein NfuA